LSLRGGDDMQYKNWCSKDEAQRHIQRQEFEGKVSAVLRQWSLPSLRANNPEVIPIAVQTVATCHKTRLFQPSLVSQRTLQLQMELGHHDRSGLVRDP
jgi:hypothetical protein